MLNLVHTNLSSDWLAYLHITSHLDITSIKLHERQAIWWVFFLWIDQYPHSLSLTYWSAILCWEVVLEGHCTSCTGYVDGIIVVLQYIQATIGPCRAIFRPCYPWYLPIEGMHADSRLWWSSCVTYQPYLEYHWYTEEVWQWHSISLVGLQLGVHFSSLGNKIRIDIGDWINDLVICWNSLHWNQFLSLMVNTLARDHWGIIIIKGNAELVVILSSKWGNQHNSNISDFSLVEARPLLILKHSQYQSNPG